MNTPLVLLHGALGDAHQFDPWLPGPGAAGKAYAFHFSGHGGLPVDGDFSISGFVADTLQFLDAQGLAQVDILGYSMGGYVALSLALHHPERVHRILTLGTKFQWDPESAAREVRMMNPEVILQKVPAFAEMLAARHAPADWQVVMQKTAAMMTRLGAGEAMTAADFKRIVQPTCICRGEADHMVTETESRHTAELLPNGVFKALPGVRHPLETLPQDMLVHLVRDWFD